MNIDDNTGPAPDRFARETVGEAFTDYLGLVDETIRTQVTNDDIKTRIRYAMDLAASGQDVGPDQPEIQRDVPDHQGGNDRSKLLDALIALMHDPRQGPAVLAGPGGTGKTTVAAALAKHARALGDQVWWIPAGDPVMLSQGLTAVAQQLGRARDVEAIARGAADAADRFWRLLENASPSWLLVFDEADDPRVLTAGDSPAGVQDLTGWVRSSARGLALVTSRETDRRMWGAAQLLTIGQLQEADAAKMLLELAPSAGDEGRARALARCLGGHPLSLRLAGTYLRSRAARGATFAAYERAFGEEAGADPHPRERHAAAPMEAMTARALKLSLDGLTQQGSPQIRAVLQLASCYGPTTIPASLVSADSLTGLLTAPYDIPPTARGRVDEALRELADIGILEYTRVASLCIPPSQKLAGPAWTTRIRLPCGSGMPRSISSPPARPSCPSITRRPGRNTCCSARTC